MEIKREGFADSVISLMFSQGVIKIFGLIYSMYLINKEGFGDSGNAIYMGGYQIYVLLLTISSIGIPNAVAKLVAERIAIKDYKSANNIFKVAFFSFGMIGFMGSVILFCCAKSIANNFLLIPECEYSLVALSPSIFFVSISSAIRGYFNGVSQISKTAKAQTIEQIFKSLLTILFVYIISKYNKNTVAMASIANFASTCAIFISFIYILFNYVQLKIAQRREEIKYNYIKNKKSNIKILKDIFSVSIPITISAVLGNLNKNIDSFTVVRILTPILGESTAKLKYGMLSSKVDMLTVMPLSFNIAFATALVPTVSSAIARKDIGSINKKLSFSLLITAIIAFPCAFGLSMYSKQILNLLFPNASSGAELLSISSFCIIFMMFTQTIGGVLHGIGKTKVTIVAMCAGIIVKLFLNIILIPIYNIYEKGAVIGNILSNIVTFIIMWSVLRQSIKLEFNFLSLIIKPLFSTILMLILSHGAYSLLITYGIREKTSIIITIIIAVFVYTLVLLILKIFSKDELALLPNGDKIYKFFKFFEKKL